MFKSEWVRIGLAICAIEICVEGLIMYLLIPFIESHLNLPDYIINLLDPLILVIITTPMITYLVIYPYITANEKIEKDLVENIKNQSELLEKLNTALIEAKHANESRLLFLANMSHEIRTPLNGIMGMLQLALHSSTDPKVIDFLKKSYDGSTHLLKILGDILDLSKIEAGEIKIEKISFSLKDEIETIYVLQKGECEKKKINFMIEIQEDIPNNLIGDPLRIKQVVNNLLNNATKFTPDQGMIKLLIESRGRDENNITLCIKVIDSGVGIPLKMQDVIFEPFTQADESTTRKYGGTGLGLCICKKIVELMGGTIALESTENIGTTFNIELRLGIDINAKSIHSKSILEREPVLRNNVKILIVEDNEMNQDVIKDMLNLIGLKAQIASCGEEAVKLFSDGNFDIILMDCQLPGLDGFETTKRIRALEKEKNKSNNNIRQCIIVALTANVLKETNDRCITSGMDGYLTKPIRLNTITATLNQYFH